MMKLYPYMVFGLALLFCLAAGTAAGIRPVSKGVQAGIDLANFSSINDLLSFVPK